MTQLTLIDAIEDENLFRPWFRDKATWRAWMTFLKALFDLRMSPGQRKIYEEATGRDKLPGQPAAEGWLVVGRRGGKSFILALIAVFLACFKDWQPYLSPGERGTVIIIATDRKQARVIFRYVEALLDNVPMLAKLVRYRSRETIELTVPVNIEIHTASFRATRGYSIVAALLDEVAFWRDESSANPDKEILDALRPGMATIPGALLLAASSPYARRGILYDAWRRHYGKDDDPVLVWQAPTKTMNPTIADRVIANAYEEDPASAAAEYGAEFRKDVEAFVPREVAEAAIVVGRYELPFVEGPQYRAFCDPSGGSQDSMTVAIAHRDSNGKVILDAVRERVPPFSPDAVTEEFCDLLKTYRLAAVEGDRYGGMWPRERFAKHGIHYDVASMTKSDLYRSLLPILNSGEIEMLDLPRMLQQLIGLERRTARGGKDTIDHAPGAKDDIINSIAGAVAMLGTGAPIEMFIGDDGPREKTFVEPTEKELLSIGWHGMGGGGGW